MDRANENSESHGSILFISTFHLTPRDVAFLLVGCVVSRIMQINVYFYEPWWEDVSQTTTGS